MPRLHRVIKASMNGMQHKGETMQFMQGKLRDLIVAQKGSKLFLSYEDLQRLAQQASVDLATAYKSHGVFGDPIKPENGLWVEFGEWSAELDENDNTSVFIHVWRVSGIRYGTRKVEVTKRAATRKLLEAAGLEQGMRVRLPEPAIAIPGEPWIRTRSNDEPAEFVYFVSELSGIDDYIRKLTLISEKIRAIKNPAAAE